MFLIHLHWRGKKKPQTTDLPLYIWHEEENKNINNKEERQKHTKKTQTKPNRRGICSLKKWHEKEDNGVTLLKKDTYEHKKYHVD